MKIASLARMGQSLLAQVNRFVRVVDDHDRDFEFVRELADRLRPLVQPPLEIDEHS